MDELWNQDRTDLNTLWVAMPLKNEAKDTFRRKLVSVLSCNDHEEWVGYIKLGHIIVKIENYILNDDNYEFYDEPAPSITFIHGDGILHIERLLGSPKIYPEEEAELLIHTQSSAKALDYIIFMNLTSLALNLYCQEYWEKYLFNSLKIIYREYPELLEYIRNSTKSYYSREFSYYKLMDSLLINPFRDTYLDDLAYLDHITKNKQASKAIYGAIFQISETVSNQWSEER